MMDIRWNNLADVLPDDNREVLWQPRKVPGQPWEVPVIGYLNEWKDKVFLSDGSAADPSLYSHWCELPEAPDDEVLPAAAEARR